LSGKYHNMMFSILTNILLCYLQLPGPHKLLRGACRQQQQHAPGGQQYGGVGSSSGVSPYGSSSSQHHHRKAKGAKQKAILQARAFKVRAGFKC
jgi:hypothetical protein